MQYTEQGAQQLWSKTVSMKNHLLSREVYHATPRLASAMLRRKE
jgi:hypothetical protein